MSKHFLSSENFPASTNFMATVINAWGKYMYLDCCYTFVIVHVEVK